MKSVVKRGFLEIEDADLADVDALVDLARSGDASYTEYGAKPGMKFRVQFKGDAAPVDQKLSEQKFRDECASRLSRRSTTALGGVELPLGRRSEQEKGADRDPPRFFIFSPEFPFSNFLPTLQ
jgi:hypothetical protein